MNIPCICHVYARYVWYIVLKANNDFLQLQYYIVLKCGMGMQHRITHKYMKIEIRYPSPLYIRGIFQAYTAALHIHGIHGIYQLYTSLGFQMKMLGELSRFN